MHTTHSFRTGLALIQQAIDHVAEHADRGAVQPLQDSLAELSDMIDDLPGAIFDAECFHCIDCHIRAKCKARDEDGNERFEIDPKQCPVVQRCGLGDPSGPFEIPEWLRRQAS